MAYKNRVATVGASRAMNSYTVKSGVRVSGKATLDKIASTSGDWKAKADAWTIRLETAAGYICLDYWTGVGNRRHRFRNKSLPHDRLSIAEYAEYLPTAPNVVDVLGCLFSDASTYIECRDELEPPDYIAETFGYTRPSEARDIFEGCKAAFVKLATLFPNEADRDAIGDEIREAGY